MIILKKFSFVNLESSNIRGHNTGAQQIDVAFMDTGCSTVHEFHLAQNVTVCQVDSLAHIHQDFIHANVVATSNRVTSLIEEGSGGTGAVERIGAHLRRGTVDRGHFVYIMR